MGCEEKFDTPDQFLNLPSALRNYMDAYDTYLAMSFVGETRVLGMNEDDELDEAEIAGFDSAASVSLLKVNPGRRNEGLQERASD